MTCRTHGLVDSRRYLGRFCASTLPDTHTPVLAVSVSENLSDASCDAASPASGPPVSTRSHMWGFSGNGRRLPAGSRRISMLRPQTMRRTRFVSRWITGFDEGTPKMREGRDADNSYHVFPAAILDRSLEHPTSLYCPGVRSKLSGADCPADRSHWRDQRVPESLRSTKTGPIETKAGHFKLVIAASTRPIPKYRTGDVVFVNSGSMFRSRSPRPWGPSTKPPLAANGRLDRLKHLRENRAAQRVIP